jgi:hypothetical protein
MMGNTAAACGLLWHGIADDLRALFRPMPEPVLEPAPEGVNDRPAFDYLRAPNMPVDDPIVAIDFDLAAGLHCFRAHCRDHLHGPAEGLNTDTSPGFVTVRWGACGALAYAHGGMSAETALVLFQAIAETEGVLR